MKYFFWLFLTTLFIIRFVSTQPHFTNGQLLRISGRLYSEPNVSGNNIIFNLSGIKIIAKAKDIHYGDNITVEGVYKDGVVMKGEIKDQQISTNIFTIVRKRIISF